MLIQGSENVVIVPPRRLEIDRPKDGLSLAPLSLEPDFYAVSLVIMRSFCVGQEGNVTAILEISDLLIKLDQLRDAEIILSIALKLDPSVTSSNHLNALCRLAELKRRLGNVDEAICLCEKVLQHVVGARHEINAAALTCLCLAHEQLGDHSEARQLRSRLQAGCAASSIDAILSTVDYAY